MMSRTNKTGSKPAEPKLDQGAQRLLNLFFVLNTSAEPLSTEQIVGDSDLGYGSSNIESDKRKFRRDRNDLTKLGIVIHEVREDGAQKTEESRWELDRERTFAAGGLITADDADLLAEAIAQTLAVGDTPFAAPLESIRTKIARLSAGSPLDAGQSHRATMADTIWSAFAARRALTFTYENARGERRERTVTIYGIFDRDGHSYFCGLDDATESIRTFRTERVIKAKRPKGAYEIPDDFDLRSRIFLPFDFSEGDAEAATFAFSAGCGKNQVAAITMGRGKLTQDEHGWLWDVEVRDMDTAASFCLEHAAEGMRPVAPEALVDAWTRDIERTVAAHA